MNVVLPSEEFLKMQNEKAAENYNQNFNRRASDMNRRASDQQIVEHNNSNNGMELLKHIGTALVAMIPLGSGYISLNNSVLESTIKIKQLEDERNRFNEKFTEVLAKIESLREENRSLREDLDNVISTSFRRAKKQEQQ